MNVLEFEKSLRTAQVNVSSAWAPQLFGAEDPTHRTQLVALLQDQPMLRVVDSIGAQLEDLARADLRLKNAPGADVRARMDELLAGRPMVAYGTWVFYPWRNIVAHVLPCEEFRRLRWDRNRYKISPREQELLASKSIVVVGLSVGRSALLNLVQEGVGTRFRLCDFDHLDLSNLNRLRGTVAEIGTNKTVLAARELFEQDPYLEIDILPNGVTDDNIDDVLADPIDLLIEECDDLYMKIKLREKARARRIPVVMETSDRGMLDVERFDLEPERPLVHGLVGDIDAAGLRGLSTKERVPFILQILDAKRMSQRLAASLAEVETTLYTWPQLASAVGLGGALACDATRRVLLGELQASGRYYVDLEQLVRDDTRVTLHTSSLQAEGVAVEARSQRNLLEVPPPSDSATSMRELSFLVEHACWAPSGGNSQPWRFRYHAEGLDCLIDPASGSFLDFEGWAQRLAIGAALENLVIATASVGLRAVVTETPELGPCVARVSWTRCERQELPLRRFIPRRVTNRRRVEKAALARTKLASLQHQAERCGLDFRFIEDSLQLTSLGAILGETDRLRALTAPYHEDLFNELRWTPEDVRKTRTGIDVQSLEMSAADIAGLQVMQRWDVAEFLRRNELGGVIRKTAVQAVLGCSGVGLLAAPERMSIIESGRRLQRFWLEATANDIAFHPWTPILAMMARAECGKDLSTHDVSAIRKQSNRLLAEWNAPSGYAPLFVFRVLEAPEAPTAISLRLPVESVLEVGP